MLGAFASANNAPISFYNVYKIYKEKHRPQRANTQRLARVYVAKKSPKCRQEIPKMSPRNPQIWNLNGAFIGVQMSSRNPHGGAASTVQMSPRNP